MHHFGNQNMPSSAPATRQDIARVLESPCTHEADVLTSIRDGTPWTIRAASSVVAVEFIRACKGLLMGQTSRGWLNVFNEISLLPVHTWARYSCQVALLRVIYDCDTAKPLLYRKSSFFIARSRYHPAFEHSLVFSFLTPAKNHNKEITQSASTLKLAH